MIYWLFQFSHLLFSDLKILRRIIELYKRWKSLEGDSRREDRSSTKNFLDKVSAFQNEANQPMNIMVKDWRERLKTSGIKEYHQDISHIENQMEVQQVGSLGGLDKHQFMRDMVWP